MKEKSSVSSCQISGHSISCSIIRLGVEGPSRSSLMHRARPFHRQCCGWRLMCRMILRLGKSRESESRKSESRESESWESESWEWESRESESWESAGLMMINTPIHRGEPRTFLSPDIPVTALEQPETLWSDMQINAIRPEKDLRICSS